MLILFLRAVLLYVFILFILRMTGKRQIADLQPFDLIITMAIAVGIALLILGKHETGLIVTKPETLNDLANRIFRSVETED